MAQDESLKPAQPDNPTKSLVNPDGKASVAAPKLSEDEQMELKDILPTGPEVSPDDDIMHMARTGDVAGIQKLFDSGKYDASYADGENITPLHWAAINNQWAMCKFLLDAGSEVNAKGGESVATPAMWAAQRCHYYVVHLLLQYGADPLITDVMGYNILHLATFDGNVFLLVLLLHQNISIDVRDTQDHTPLMWAAYKGFPACVDLFLRWGADVHATDDTGFTALHWALVKGSPGCIQKLVEYGSDRFAASNGGKTPLDTAREQNTTRLWYRALRECGYQEDGTPKSLKLPLSSWLLKDKRATISKFFFFTPFIIIYCMILVVSNMVVYAGVPFALIIGYSMHWFVQKGLEYSPSDMRHMHKTPWLAGIFAGSLFWVGVAWLTHILPVTYSLLPFTNLLFVASYGLCTYFYFCTMFFDPGYVPKLGGLTEQKEAIDELLGLWKYDDQNFCVPCMVRMPLRSKHCKRCNRCVAKHDHHCPWVYNCIGVNNQRHFVLYLITLQIGISLLVRLSIKYFEAKIGDNGDPVCNLLSPRLCKTVNADPFTVVLVIWATLQLTWTTMLMFVQMVQVSRAMTTYENMRSSHGHPSQAAEAITSALTAGTTSMAGAQLGAGGHGPDPALPPTHAPHAHHHRQGCFATWKRILGVDTFLETAFHGYGGSRNRVARARKPKNPFSRGIIGNCKDFWCDPAPIFGPRENGSAMLGGVVVNYTTVYETPPRMSLRTRSNGATSGGGAYESVATDDDAV